jgi:ribosomal 50S subunit-associated protein YjgA (DUF615 family)
MTETDSLPPLPPSKTRLKQAAHDLQALGARLVDLPKDRLQRFLGEGIRSRAHPLTHPPGR